MDIISLNNSWHVFLLTSLVGILLGLILGRLLSNKRLSKKLEELQEETLKKETEIAGDIYGSLYELHKGLVQTVQSYDSAVKTVLDKLPTPVEKLEELGLDASTPKAISLIQERMADEPSYTSTKVRIPEQSNKPKAAQQEDSDFSKTDTQEAEAFQFEKTKTTSA